MGVARELARQTLVYLSGREFRQAVNFGMSEIFLYRVRFDVESVSNDRHIISVVSCGFHATNLLRLETYDTAIFALLG